MKEAPGAAESERRDSMTLTDNRTGRSWEVPILHGTLGPDVVDVRRFYAETGMFTYDLNFHWNVFKPWQNPGAAAVVQVQTWFRDPGNTSNQTTSLSDALELTVCP